MVKHHHSEIWHALAEEGDDALTDDSAKPSEVTHTPLPSTCTAVQGTWPNGCGVSAQDGEGADPMKLLQQTTTAMQPGQKASRNSAAATKQLEYLASIGANVEIVPLSLIHI